MTLFIFLFLFNSTYSKSDLIISKSDSIKIQETKNSTNSEVYNLLYENSKKNNTELLETFRWSIGSIIIIILAIFGSSIFFNFRFNKKELENLLQQIDLKIQDEKSNLLKQIEDDNKNIREEFENLFSRQLEKNEELIKNISLKVEDTSRELSSKYQNQLDTFNQNYLQQINSLNESFNSQIKILSDSYNQQFKIYNDNIDNKISSLKQEIESKEFKLENLINNSKDRLEYTEKRIKMDAARIKAKLWDHKEVYANSLTYRIEELAYAIEFKSNLEFYLEDLIENLNKMREISKWDYDKVKKMIDKIDDTDYKDQKEIIFEIISTKLVK